MQRDSSEPSSAVLSGARHTARAILLQGDFLVLIRRLQPSRGPEPYWVTVGGGIEPGDAGPEDTMRREVKEEVGGVVGPAQQVLVLAEPKEEGERLTYFFLALLESMDTSNRVGEEFSIPGRGTYDVEKIPFTRDAITSIKLQPEELATYLASNVDGLRLLAASMTA
ncbi:NUDIX hydrolase [Catenulispora subtropica]|uniref:Nudix hydrolase domain-containing protein n=1 Tax=Catenulispora subtropica TaxID=450798 RepID=A0ABP5EPM5_9ACTN